MSYSRTLPCRLRETVQLSQFVPAPYQPHETKEETDSSQDEVAICGGDTFVASFPAYLEEKMGRPMSGTQAPEKHGGKKHTYKNTGC